MTENAFLKNSLPVAPVRILSLECAAPIGDLVNQHLVNTRKKRDLSLKNDQAFSGYAADDFRVSCAIPRFGSGESKAIISHSVRGTDLFLLVDIMNYSITYKMYGYENAKSPDDHFQDCKRVISALSGHCHRINLIMPFLFESRQHHRLGRESLDCALALRELMDLGVSNIITFDAHDPRVQNAIPIVGFDNFMAFDYYITALFKYEKDLIVHKDNMAIICPNEGALDRGIYLSTILGVDTGLFYKRRDYSQGKGGRSPIVAHEYLGDDVDGKDIIIIDDMISGGESMLDTAGLLKKKGARRVFLCATFGLFTLGMAMFDKAYENCVFDRIVTTNLVYNSLELKSKPYFVEVDMSSFLAKVIDYMNHDVSMSNVLTPSHKFTAYINKYNDRESL